MSTTKHDIQAALAKQIDDAPMDAVYGGPGRREQAQREFAASTSETGLVHVLKGASSGKTTQEASLQLRAQVGQ